MRLNEIKTSQNALHLAPVKTGNRTRFSSKFQFNGTLAAQWGKPQRTVGDDKVEYYKKAGEVVAKWNQIDNSGFVVSSERITEERDGGVLKRAGEIVAAEINKLYKVNAPERNNSNGLIIVASDFSDAYKGSMKAALVAASKKATEKVRKDLGVDIIVNIDDPFEIGVVKKQKLKEEALDTVKVEDLWKDSADSVKEYRTAATYLVRPIKDSKPTEYEAFEVKGDQRKPFGKYSAADLSKVLQPIRAGQKPDAEGFTTYVDTDKVEAFQYAGEPIKVMLKDIGHRLNKGDYVIRTNDGNDFNYTIDTAPDFEATLTEI